MGTASILSWSSGLQKAMVSRVQPFAQRSPLMFSLDAALDCRENHGSRNLPACCIRC